MFLVTGHPRSGTTYARRVFETAGLKVGGEGFGRHRGAETADMQGVVSWRHIVDCRSRFTVIAHQVRNPLSVISSAQTLTNGAFRLMFRTAGVPARWWLLLKLRRTFPGVTRRWAATWAMRTWVDWNEYIERDDGVVIRYRVEEIAEEWPRITAALGLAGHDFPAEIPRSVNTRKGRYTPLQFDDLTVLDGGLAARVDALARTYGYDLHAV